MLRRNRISLRRAAHRMATSPGSNTDMARRSRDTLRRKHRGMSAGRPRRAS
jgi:hypothetical protein